MAEERLEMETASYLTPEALEMAEGHGPHRGRPCSRSSSDACPAAGCYSHPGFHHHATAVRRRDIRPNREERKFRWRVASAVAGALARPPGIRYSCDHVRAASRECPARNLQDCSAGRPAGPDRERRLDYF